MAMADDLDQTPPKRVRRPEQPQGAPNPSLPVNLYDPGPMTPSPRAQSAILGREMSTPPAKTPRTRRFQQLVNLAATSPTPSSGSVSTLELSPTVAIRRMDIARAKARALVAKAKRVEEAKAAGFESTTAAPSSSSSSSRPKFKFWPKAKAIRARKAQAKATKAAAKSKVKA